METEALTPEQTDRLLAQIDAQLATGTFDSSDSQLLQRLVAALADDRGMVRFGFVEAFGKIGKPMVPFLLAGLKHPNPVVRRSAGKGLAKIGDPQAIGTLIEALLYDDDTVARSSAAGALAKMGASAVTALLEVLAGDYPETAKGHAAWAISFIGPSAREELYRARDSDSADVRTAVVSAIGNIVQAETDDCAARTLRDRALKLLLAALTDSSEQVRAEAATTLGSVGHQPAVTQLINLLADDSSEVRKAAALALGKIGDVAAIAPLQAQIRTGLQSESQVFAVAIAQIDRKNSDDD